MTSQVIDRLTCDAEDVPPPQWAARAMAWAIECGVFLASGSLSPTVLGQAFVVVQIVAVLAFAELQYMGLKRACAIVPA